MARQTSPRKDGALARSTAVIHPRHALRDVITGTRSPPKTRAAPSRCSDYRLLKILLLSAHLYAPRPLVRYACRFTVYFSQRCHWHAEVAAAAADAMLMLPLRQLQIFHNIATYFHFLFIFFDRLFDNTLCAAKPLCQQAPQHAAAAHAIRLCAIFVRPDITAPLFAC